MFPRIIWYKQRMGDTLKLIAQMQKSIEPVYNKEFSESRMEIQMDDKFINLTILTTIPEDEGMYHCAILDYDMKTWSGTYLTFKGKTPSSLFVINGTEVDSQETSLRSQKENIMFVLLCAVLALCLSVITFYICTIIKDKNNSHNGAVSLDKVSHGHKRCEDTGAYSAAVFTVVKTDSKGGKNGKFTERQKIYAAIKTFGLD
ncbi:uncharacterized protein LOC115427384 [Sphaeramia orbicularis]|uniref:uncharacterized protein LOC115427384 n=1 Tax=Sphaeramia orbicularis TaxID=375764 RepID=UPI00117EFD18|nr:uncharacterized protein LOC115427384 [Sphaeramia orbicularis]